MTPTPRNPGSKAARRPSIPPPPKEQRSERLTEALRWAIDSSIDPAEAAADWLAHDIDSDYDTAAGLLTSPRVPLLALKKAKTAYKAMRVVGETSADRRLGARLYAAAIAAGLVWHGRRISQQSDTALRRAFTGLLDDREMPRELRDLAGRALTVLAEGVSATDRSRDGGNGSNSSFS